MAEVDFSPVDTKIDFGHAAIRVTPSCVCAARHLRCASSPKQHFRDFVERVCPSSSISMAPFMKDGKKKMKEGGSNGGRKSKRTKSALPQGASRTLLR